MPEFVAEALYAFFKRCLDILGSIVGLLLFAVLYIFVAPAIKIDSRGPVLVELERISRGKRIYIFKFRSMVANAPALGAELRKKGKNERVSGPFFKMKKDPRITRVGHFLRKYRLDEFPQFVNVFFGAMSLVGPRPHQPDEVAGYPAEFQGVPLEKAGITGLSQISGASTLSFQRELQLDTYYIEHKSFWLDLTILWKTVVVMLQDPTAV